MVLEMFQIVIKAKKLASKIRIWDNLFDQCAVSALFQHILLLEKVFALLQQNVHLITGVRCPPYSNIVSALFQHNVRLIPTS